MRLKKPYIATLDQVRISRKDDCGVIEYTEPNVWTVNLRIGPQVQGMTDQEILDEHNRVLEIQLQMAAEYEHVAVEIPPGRPQIVYSDLCAQWTPRGDVLRCVIDDGGPGRQAVIHVDDHDLSLEEFGRLLCTYAGWGMRIVFVPDDRIDEEPEIEVRDPDDGDVPSER